MTPLKRAGSNMAAGILIIFIAIMCYLLALVTGPGASAPTNLPSIIRIAPIVTTNFVLAAPGATKFWTNNFGSVYSLDLMTNQNRAGWRSALDVAGGAVDFAVNVRDYMTSSNIAAALGTITNAYGSSSNVCIQFPRGIYNLDGNVGIGGNYTLRFDPGATIYGTNTFRHAGPIDAGPTHIFDTNLTVKLTPQKIDTCYWEWWGAIPINGRTGTYDSTIPINRAFQSWQASVYPLAGAGYPGQQLGMTHRPLGIYGISGPIHVPAASVQIIGRGPVLDGSGLKWVGSTTDTNNQSKTMLRLNSGNHMKVYGMSFIGPLTSDTNAALRAAIELDCTDYGDPWMYNVLGKDIEIQHCEINPGSGEFMLDYYGLSARYNFIAGFRIGGSPDPGNFDFGRVENTSFSHCHAAIRNDLGQSVNWYYDNIRMAYCRIGVWTRYSSYMHARSVYLGHIETAFMFGDDSTGQRWHRAVIDYVGGERMQYFTSTNNHSLIRVDGNPSIFSRISLSHVEIAINDTSPPYFNGSSMQCGLYVSDQPIARHNISFEDSNFGSGVWWIDLANTLAGELDIKPSFTFKNCAGMQGVRLDFGQLDYMSAAVRMDNCQITDQVETPGTGHKPLNIVRDFFTTDKGANTYVNLGYSTNVVGFGSEDITLGRMGYGHRARIRNFTYRAGSGTNWYVTLNNILPANSVILGVSARLTASNPLRTGNNSSVIDLGLTNQPIRFGSVKGTSAATSSSSISATNQPLYIASSGSPRTIQLRGRYGGDAAIPYSGTYNKTDAVTVVKASGDVWFASSFVGDQIEFHSGPLAGIRYNITNYVSSSQVQIDCSNTNTFSGVYGTVHTRFAAKSHSTEITVTAIVFNTDDTYPYGNHADVPLWSSLSY